MSRERTLASLSVDLDNRWSYMKTHGNPEWREYPSYLDLVVPRILKFLKEEDIISTFFVVGQDAVNERNHSALASIVEAGHEIGNHSFNHEPWLHLYSEEDIEREIIQAEEAIANFSNEPIVGFRGPGYSISDATLRVLNTRRYLYDASTLPTFIGPLARAYYFASSKLNSEQLDRRGKLFGTFRDGLRPLKPYHIGHLGSDKQGTIIEIPVTTMPILKVPIHTSYILFLSKFSFTIALQYFRTALWLCHITKVKPSLLLHPLDFIDGTEAPELSFFPAMDLAIGQKLKVLNAMVKLMTSRYEVLPMAEYAERLLANESLPIVSGRYFAKASASQPLRSGDIV